MAINVRRLISPTQVANATTTYYTATNVRATLDKVTLTNTTAGAVTMELWLVPNAGSASDSNKILDGVSIAAHGSYLCPEVVGHTLEPGETLQAKASAATSVSLRASGREVS